MQAKSVVLVTGASSGFGRAIAEHLSAQGMTVYGTSRRPPGGDGPYTMLRMDVGDAASVRAAVDQVIADVGRIDVVVNNAGIGVSGSVEDTSMEEATLQLDTNFFGAVRVIQTVLPHMRQQRGGKIVNISSIAGLLGMPFQAFYSASKFAMEGLTEGLRLELMPFGIDVVLVEPGDFRTGFTANRIIARGSEGSPYASQCRRTLDVYVNEETNGADPILLAHVVDRIIATSFPKVRYTVGAPSQRFAALLKRVLSARMFERLMRTYCRIAVPDGRR
jgi:NAD(P)-dependent dehydrogenase (short-subunit alcohol dehydrogenase family)